MRARLAEIEQLVLAEDFELDTNSEDDFFTEFQESFRETDDMYGRARVDAGTTRSFFFLSGGAPVRHLRRTISIMESTHADLAFWVQIQLKIGFNGGLWIRAVRCE